MLGVHYIDLRSRILGFKAMFWGEPLLCSERLHLPSDFEKQCCLGESGTLLKVAKVLLSSKHYADPPIVVYANEVESLCSYISSDRTLVVVDFFSCTPVLL